MPLEQETICKLRMEIVHLDKRPWPKRTHYPRSNPWTIVHIQKTVNQNHWLQLQKSHLKDLL